MWLNWRPIQENSFDELRWREGKKIKHKYALTKVIRREFKGIIAQVPSTQSGSKYLGLRCISPSHLKMTKSKFFISQIKSRKQPSGTLEVMSTKFKAPMMEDTTTKSSDPWLWVLPHVLKQLVYFRVWDTVEGFEIQHWVQALILGQMDDVD